MRLLLAIEAPQERAALPVLPPEAGDKIALRSDRTLARQRWFAAQKFEPAAQQIVFQEGIDAIEDALQRLRRLEEQLASSCRSGQWRRLWKPIRQCARRFSSP